MSPRTVFVTGVSSGIGYALAEAHLEEGDRVYGVSRRKPTELMGRDRFTFASADLVDDHSAKATIGELLKECRHVHVAWLNAGILGRISDLADAESTDLKATMEVNLWAQQSTLQTLFAEQRTVDHVLTMSSGAAVNGNRGWSGYSLSKAALNMLTQLWAAERPQTHFTAFAPGLVDTAMQEHVRGRKPDERFPSLEVLRAAGGTEAMPHPSAAARTFVSRLKDLKEKFPSGGFVDIRKMDD